MNIEPRLHDLGIVLPAAPTSIGFYSPWVGVGDLIYISGQLSKHEGTLMTGKLGEGLSRNQGRTAAQYCMINVLAVLKSACMNDLDHVLRAVQLSGYINATGSFREHAFVMDGASEIVQAIWGEEAGSHARTTIGCQSLPMDATMEVSAIFQVKTG